MALAEAKERLAGALRLAQSGQRSAAMAIAPEILSQFPEDLHVLHHAGLVYRACEAFPQALTCFHRALATTPHFHFTELEIAQVHWSRGDFDKARVWFDAAIGSRPDYIPAYIAAAKMELARGRGPAALILLKRAYSYDTNNLQVLLTFADVLIFQNQREAALTYLEAALLTGKTGTEVHRRYIDILSDAGQYTKLIAHRRGLPAVNDRSFESYADMLTGHAKLAMSYDRSATIVKAGALEASERWLSSAALLKVLKQSIATRRPYSFIRVGDGEARFLAYLEPRMRVSLLLDEIEAIGRAIWSNWFDQEISMVAPQTVMELGKAFGASLEDADAIGVPMASRLSVDFKHFGYLAYLYQYVSLILDRRPETAVSNASSNVDMHRLSPFLRQILSGLDFLGVVSPHPDLANRLARHLGIARVVTYTIPGEMRLPERPGLARGQGHFPERYDQLMTEIVVPQRGAVFLVAAGLLGKVYCARVKKLGGIAIDIGALADAWMGFDTRPGSFDKGVCWKLPACAGCSGEHFLPR